jgi:hypothetical protein
MIKGVCKRLQGKASGDQEVGKLIRTDTTHDLSQAIKKEEKKGITYAYILKGFEVSDLTFRF